LVVALEEHNLEEACLLEIRGPAGIGKTRLLDELAERMSAHGASCLRGG
jgi:Ni2+-binding GTPase involved in maturation of urease and hydrogenase